MNYYYVINNIFNFTGVSTIFSDVIEQSDLFRIHFFDNKKDEMSKTAGKEEFLNLKDIDISKSEFGLNGIAIKGKLDTTSKNLFYSYFNKAYNGDVQNSLCQFEIYKDNLKVFEIQNFKIGYLLKDFYDKEEREELGLAFVEAFIL